jgi:16S rRNA processing protein RimM
VSSQDNKIKMGFAAHPHGIKGEVELRATHPDAPEVLTQGMTLWLYPAGTKSIINKSGEAWRLKQLRMGNKLLGMLEGVRDRTHLEQLLPFEFYVERTDFPEPAEDDFYLSDLVGLNVFSPAGEQLGVLESLSDNGMQELLDVRLSNGELITLPFVEVFFPEVDVESGRIVMVLPEYTE